MHSGVGVGTAGAQEAGKWGAAGCEGPTEGEENGVLGLTLLPSSGGIPEFQLLLPCLHFPGAYDGAEAKAAGPRGHATGLGVARLLVCKGVLWAWEGGSSERDG